MTVINLRGVMGAGKTTVGRALVDPSKYTITSIKLAPYKTKGGQPRVVPGYHNENLDLIVVGSYEITTGGCDSVRTQELVCESVRIASCRATHVFFEGATVAAIYGRYLELSKWLHKHSQTMIWAYLDTPLDVCLERIRVRAGGKPWNEALVRTRERGVRSTQHKAELAGQAVRTIQYKQAVQQVLQLLRR